MNQWSSRRAALADCEAAAPAALATIAEACGDLLELFGSVSGGRSDQGRDDPVAAVLALAAAAVAGMKGYTAISRWVKDVPPAVLAVCTCGQARTRGCRGGAARRPAPSRQTRPVPWDLERGTIGDHVESFSRRLILW
jgi:hypothetical protein